MAGVVVGDKVCASDEFVELAAGRRERTDQVGLERRAAMSSWGFGGSFGDIVGLVAKGSVGSFDEVIVVP
jgi:hypothetical protein